MSNNLEAFKSAVMLCAKRLSLINEIKDVDALLTENFISDKDFVNYYAKNYINKGNIILRLMVSALPIIPFAMIMPKYNLSNDDGTVYAVGIVIICCLIFTILSFINKAKKKNIARKKYLPDYAKRRDAVMKSREELKVYKSELQQELSDLIKIMQDREICILHPNYWDDALKIWALIELGRATSMASAINLFESLKREEQRDFALQQQLENSQRTLESQIKSERYAKAAAENSSRAEMYSLFTLASTLSD